MSSYLGFFDSLMKEKKWVNMFTNAEGSHQIFSAKLGIVSQPGGVKPLVHISVIN